MEREISSLLLKSNRTLGTRLVEAGLCGLKDIEAANEMFVEKVRAGSITQASLLRILVFEKQVIDEAEYLDRVIENHDIGALSLESYEINEKIAYLVDQDILKATWSIPIDCLEGHYFVATAYYLSDIVKQYWEDRLDGSITWYACTMHDIESYLEGMNSMTDRGSE